MCEALFCLLGIQNKPKQQQQQKSLLLWSFLLEVGESRWGREHTLKNKLRNLLEDNKWNEEYLNRVQGEGGVSEVRVKPH